MNEYKYEIEKLTRENQETKTKYFEQKKREQMRKENVNPHQNAKSSQNQVQRFTGGGFNLAI